MKFKNFMQLVASTAVMLGISAAAAFGQTTVTFDNDASAPTAIESVTSGGPDGPTIATSDITFTGGVEINSRLIYGTLGLGPNPATSGSNIYLTEFPITDPSTPKTDNGEIDNGNTPLPGAITGTLTTPGQFQTISFDLINATNDPSTVTVTAFNSSNVALESQAFNFEGVFNDFNSNGGVIELADEVDHVVLNDSGISYFTVTTPNIQTDGSPTFGIDTVTLTTPEPSTVAGILIGCIVLGTMVIKRKREMAKTSI